MSTSSDTNFCRLTCWGLGLLAGLLVAAVLALLFDFTTMMSLLIGLVSFLVLGYLLSRLVCTGYSTSTMAAGAGALGAAGAVGAGAAASARSTASETAGAVGGAVAGAGAAASSAGAAVGDAVSAEIKPSASLSGEEELASRQGSWRYEGGDSAGADADAAAAKAKADADAAAAKAKADADAAAARARADADAAAAKAKADADAAAARAKSEADAATAKARADADAAARAKADAAAKAKADADAKARADAAAKKAKAATAAGAVGAGAAVAAAASSGSGTKPAALTSARGGKADDLKKINGVGPKLEGTLNGMGVYHYDQIAGWKKKELEWVDGNLEGFHGRASRDQWIPQAKLLAKGKTPGPEFANAGSSSSSASAGSTGSGTKPKALKAARGGKADDLKKINGIGPKLEGTLNGMGVYHYDQIAGWKAKELDWVDSNLEGFYGRASRDEWVPQAKKLMGADSGSRDYDGDGIIEGADEGVKPSTLKAARGGKADDLKQIKGVGPKMEKMCNKLGFYHFDQIAAWSRDEVAWVDANLEGFRGRVSRDEWVKQAKTLAAGGATEFSKRVKGGDVY